MMFTFKKFSRSLKRTVCVVLCLIFLSSLLVIQAGAADYSGIIYFGGNASIGGTSWFSGGAFDTPTESSDATVTLYSQSSSSARGNSFSFDLNSIYIVPRKVLDGSVGIYLSVFPYINATGAYSVTSPGFRSSDISLKWSDPDGVYQSASSSVDVVSSYPTFGLSDEVPRGSMYTVKLRANVSSLVAAQVLLVDFNSDNSYEFTPLDPNAAPITAAYLRLPTTKVIFSDSVDSLMDLESIADSIASQSQVMSAYYGDIMELLNDLYSKLGDVQRVQETANAYFAQLIPLVNSISSNTANIHSLLQTQFQLLRTLIETESDDIQSAIEQQTDDLIAYFDTVLSGSTGDMPEKSDDLQTSVGNFNNAESEYQSNAAQRFNELSSTFSGFSGGTLSGITLASTLFSRVWSALGEYNIVYYFPLLLGLSLVIIGRLPRGSGGQSSSEKHRGDSSA